MYRYWQYCICTPVVLHVYVLPSLAVAKHFQIIERQLFVSASQP